MRMAANISSGQYQVVVPPVIDYGLYLRTRRMLEPFSLSPRDRCMFELFSGVSYLIAGYWRRMWVVQEIMVATSVVVHCGQDYQRWDQLFERGFGPRTKPNYFDGIRLYSGKTPYAGDEDSHLSRYVDLHTGPQTFLELQAPIATFPHARVNEGLAIRLSSGGHSPLSTVLHVSNPLGRASTSLAQTICEWSEFNFQCSDRRDRVYALLSLSTKQAIVLPDYDIGVTALFLRVYNQLIDFDAMQEPTKIYTSEFLRKRSETVGILMPYLNLMVDELRQVLQTILRMKPRPNFANDHTYLAPIAHASASVLRFFCVYDDTVFAALENRLDNLLHLPQPNIEAATIAIRHELVEMVKAIDGKYRRLLPDDDVLSSV